MTNMTRLLRPIFLSLILSLVFSPSYTTHPAYQIPTTGSNYSSDGNISSANSGILLAFEKQVYNGNDDQITGLYVEGILANFVLQQPQGHPEFVDTGENTVTQFSSASSFGSLGFLAHNYKAGKIFPSLEVGEEIIVVYGDSHIDHFIIMDTLQVKAVSPNSTVSDFIDLESGETLSVYDLFDETYGLSGNLVLQTCISEQGIGSWGRFFIIAEPLEKQNFPIEEPNISVFPIFSRPGRLASL